MCLDMNDFYLGLVPQEERDRVESLEPFDEHEVSWFWRGGGSSVGERSERVCFRLQEWNQKCSHYFILTASRGALMEKALLPQTSGRDPRPPIHPIVLETLSSSGFPVCSAVRRSELEPRSPERASGPGASGGPGVGLHPDQAAGGAAHWRVRQRGPGGGDQVSPQRSGGVELHQSGSISRSGSASPLLHSPTGLVDLRGLLNPIFMDPQERDSITPSPPSLEERWSTAAAPPRSDPAATC